MPLHASARNALSASTRYFLRLDRLPKLRVAGATCIDSSGDFRARFQCLWFSLLGLLSELFDQLPQPWGSKAGSPPRRKGTENRRTHDERQDGARLL